MEIITPPTIESEIDTKISQIKDWLYIGGSDLLGITLTDAQLAKAETVMRTLEMVKGMNAELKDRD